MSEYKWCHGPKCHTLHTQDRIRGVKGNKVLRTKRIKQNKWNENTYYSTFCSQGCYTDFLNAHWNEFTRLHPRLEALETPINVTKENYETHWGNRVTTNIEVDESRQVG